MNASLKKWLDWAMSSGHTLYGEDDMPLREWRPGTSFINIANELVEVARFESPEEFVPMVPASVQRALREITRTPPKTLEYLNYVEHPTYSAAYFEGLTQEEGERKVLAEELATKQSRFEALWSIHRYFTDHPA